MKSTWLFIIAFVVTGCSSEHTTPPTISTEEINPGPLPCLGATPDRNCIGADWLDFRDAVITRSDSVKVHISDTKFELYLIDREDASLQFEISVFQDKVTGIVINNRVPYDPFNISHAVSTTFAPIENLKKHYKNIDWSKDEVRLTLPSGNIDIEAFPRQYVVRYKAGN